jgi:hypothetical protein
VFFEISDLLLRFKNDLKYMMLHFHRLILLQFGPDVCLCLCVCVCCAVGLLDLLPESSKVSWLNLGVDSS